MCSAVTLLIKPKTLPVCHHISLDPPMPSNHKGGLHTMPILIRMIRDVLTNGKIPLNLPPSHPAKAVSDVWHRLSMMEDNLIILDNDRIIVPKASHESILKLLHTLHCSIAKTLSTAQCHYYWPSMKNDITNLINSCKKCQHFWSSLPNNVKILTVASKPMEKVCIDLFKISGNHYLLIVDRLSRYPWVKKLHNLSTIHVLEYVAYIF